MDEYQIVFARFAGKELAALPQSTGDRVLQRIEELATEPRPRGSRKLAGSDDLWRLRVGQHRVLYAIDDSKRIVDIVAIRHRRDAYR